MPFCPEAQAGGWTVKGEREREKHCKRAPHREASIVVQAVVPEDHHARLPRLEPISLCEHDSTRRAQSALVNERQARAHRIARHGLTLTDTAEI